MTDQPADERYKAEMPQIPGLSGPGPRRPSSPNPAIRLVAGLVAVLVVIFLGVRWVTRSKHVDPPPAEPPPQIEVPAAEPDPSAAYPHATEANPGIATVTEMAKPWSSKNFFFRNRLSGEQVPALLVRLPGGSPMQAASYWAFSMHSPYGNCELEYVDDMYKLKTDYGYRAARHPMVGNPCSRTLFDPLRLGTVPGNLIVRGAIAQGSDLRPPLGVQLKIEGKEIQAIRME